MKSLGILQCCFDFALTCKKTKKEKDQREKYLLFHHFQIREEMELENLAKMYLADLIKKDCWDNMVVKGRGIGVSNFF